MQMSQQTSELPLSTSSCSNMEKVSQGIAILALMNSCGTQHGRSCITRRASPHQGLSQALHKLDTKS